MNIFSMILLIFAFVLFAAAALVRPPEPFPSRFVYWGLACWALAEIVLRAGTVLH